MSKIWDELLNLFVYTPSPYSSPCTPKKASHHIPQCDYKWRRGSVPIEPFIAREIWFPDVQLLATSKTTSWQLRQDLLTPRERITWSKRHLRHSANQCALPLSLQTVVEWRDVCNYLWLWSVKWWSTQIKQVWLFAASRWETRNAYTQPSMMASSYTLFASYPVHVTGFGVFILWHFCT